MSEFSISFPYPAPELSPNSRVHWSKKAEAARDAKGFAYLQARGAGAADMKFFKNGNYILTMVIHPPDLRRRDEDNVKAMLKPYLDGICLALGIDDSRIVESYTKKAGAKPGGGEILLTISLVETGKPWRCPQCATILGLVQKKSNGEPVLLIHQGGVWAEIESGSMRCPVCRHERRWVMGEERLAKLLGNYSKTGADVV